MVKLGIFILVAVFGMVAARPQNPHQAHITRYDSDIGNPNRYQFAVETSDGFKHLQAGEIVKSDTGNAALVVKGYYSYVGPDGVTYSVIYTADENGFHPAGTHIPLSAGVKKLDIPPATIATLVGGNVNQH